MTSDYDYPGAVVRVLRAAGKPLPADDLWDRVMRLPDVPADDRELYWTPPFIPGPHPRNFVKLKIVSLVAMSTDMGDDIPGAPLRVLEEGYWLPEWGPLPAAEVQRRRAINERHRTSGQVSRTPSAQEVSSAQSGTKKSGGCYIATAVYGSYDAPEVLTLRKFRDGQLATTRSGRALIRAYYAVSPPLARWLGGADRMNALTRRVLDRIVRTLESRAHGEP